MHKFSKQLFIIALQVKKKRVLNICGFHKKKTFYSDFVFFVILDPLCLYSISK